MEIELINTGILGVNTWIVNLAENAVFIVDPACCHVTNDENVIFNYLESHNKTPVGVLLTHGHFDHVMGLKILKQKFPSLCIAIHKNDAAYIGSNSKDIQQKTLSNLGDYASALYSAVDNLPEPNVFLQDGLTLDNIISKDMILQSYSNDTSIDVKSIQNVLNQWSIIHTPGHTKGCVCFYNEQEKTLISGDTIFYGCYGRTDLYDGDEIQIKQSIQKIKQTILPETLVYPGHDRFGFVFSDIF